ncbi:hypothetical protein VTJ83DRAFT_4090 [Remersonia thermophila]|uniref:Uncharacterized protein n=1 Tax=Remersonia thermophila TaxID=72144 RepID=A0ABR4DG22_9PEZI
MMGERTDLQRGRGQQTRGWSPLAAAFLLVHVTLAADKFSVDSTQARVRFPGFSLWSGATSLRSGRTCRDPSKDRDEGNRVATSERPDIVQSSRCPRVGVNIPGHPYQVSGLRSRACADRCRRSLILVVELQPCCGSASIGHPGPSIVAVGSSHPRLMLNVANSAPGPSIESIVLDDNEFRRFGTTACPLLEKHEEKRLELINKVHRLNAVSSRRPSILGEP